MDYMIDFVLQQNWTDIIFSTTALATTMALHYYVRSKVHGIAVQEKLNEKGPLPDLVHRNIPCPSGSGTHIDYIIRYMLLGFVLVCLIFNRFDLCIHLMKLFVILKNFRTVCMSVTILPDISGGGRHTWLNGGTNDLMFSGHVMLSTLTERFYVTYFVREDVFWLPGIFNLIIIINTIVTRRHYTIDVLLAWYITYTFFELSNRIFVSPSRIEFLNS